MEFTGEVSKNGLQLGASVLLLTVSLLSSELDL